jgi:hypothetical protein
MAGGPPGWAAGDQKLNLVGNTVVRPVRAKPLERPTTKVTQTLDVRGKRRWRAKTAPERGEGIRISP